jgi:DNA polymerase-1
VEELFEKVSKEFPGIERKSFLEIRSAFVAEDGWDLIVEDLSQIELRFIAHITGDPLFMRAYLFWECTNCGSSGEHDVILHSCPNCGITENEKILKDKTVKGMWHGIDMHRDAADSIPALKGDRQAGKTANFAVGYCAGAMKMHLEYPMFSVRQWQQVIDQYLLRHRLVKKWHLQSEQIMWSGSPVVNVFGRKRRLLRHEIRKSPKHALNQIVNFGPQSGAGDYIQKAGKDIREDFIKQGVWLKDVRPVNFVHDELLFEARKEVSKERAAVIAHHLEHAVKLRVPVRASCNIVQDWFSGK